MSDDSTNPTGESLESTQAAADALLNWMSPSDSEDTTTEAQEEENSDVEDPQEATSSEVEESEEEEEVEASTEDQPETPEEEATDYILELDGEQFTEARLIEMKNGSMMQEDYTRKTQALAQEKKEWEEQKEQELVDFRKELEQRLAKFGEYAANDVQQYAEINWDKLRNEDPIEYQTKWTDYQRAVERAKEADSEIQKVLDDDKAKLAEQRATYLQEQNALTLELMPELKDEDTARTFISDATQFLTDNNFSPDEIASIQDAKALKLIKDAMEYNKLQSSGKKVVTKKKVSRTKVLKPGSVANKATKDERAIKKRANQMNRLEESGSIQDAMTLFQDYV